MKQTLVKTLHLRYTDHDATLTTTSIFLVDVIEIIHKFRVFTCITHRTTHLFTGSSTSCLLLF